MARCVAIVIVPIGEKQDDSAGSRGIFCRASLVSQVTFIASKRAVPPENLGVANFLCARAFVLAAELSEDGACDRNVIERYAGWRTPEAQALLRSERSLEEIAAASADVVAPQPTSGR